MSVIIPKQLACSCGAIETLRQYTEIIVTDRDLALKIVAKGHNAKSAKVEAVMTCQVVTCR